MFPSNKRKKNQFHQVWSVSACVCLVSNGTELYHFLKSNLIRRKFYFQAFFVSIHRRVTVYRWTSCGTSQVQPLASLIDLKLNKYYLQNDWLDSLHRLYLYTLATYRYIKLFCIVSSSVSYIKLHWVRECVREKALHNVNCQLPCS